MGILVLSFLPVLLSLCFLAPSTMGMPIRPTLKDIQEKANIPALAYLVLQDDRVIDAQAVGRRRVNSTTKVTINDKWHIGSCLKAMTSTMLARLVEKGQIQWSSTLKEIIGTTHADLANVTVQQLLTHTSGLTGNFEIADFSDLPSNFDEIRKQRSKIVSNILQKAPETTPGSSFNYSNVGYTVAGVMAERVTGKSYETLMREEVFGPLGMNGYGFGAPGIGNENSQPWGHFKDKNNKTVPVRPGPLADNPQAMAPAGTVHMSLQDLARFARAHLQGGKSGLLRRETFDRLHTPIMANYAFGWQVADGFDEIKNTTIWYHGGSNGKFLALMGLVPKNNTAVLLATNIATEQAGEALIRTITEILIPKFLKGRIEA